MNGRVWYSALLIAWFSLQTVEASDVSKIVAPPKSDQIVLVSTRNYPSSVGKTLQLNSLCGYEYSPSGKYKGARVDILNDDDGYAETWIFVHGNQIPPKMAIERGAKVYRNLRPFNAVGPVRFVIWSWPSERRTNRIADAKAKAVRTDAESFYFGSFLAALAHGSRIPTSIIGYSFGARVVSGGLHLAAGGGLGGYCLPETADPEEPYRVAFLAAAVESDGFYGTGRYNRAFANVDRLLLQNNSRDSALRFFWIINGAKPTALGFSGLKCAPRHCQVQQFDWGKIIGRDHSVWQYMDRPKILERISRTISHGSNTRGS